MLLLQSVAIIAAFVATTEGALTCPTKSGKPCVLPFSYGGKKATECLATGSQYWCATDVKADLTMSSSAAWDYCLKDKCEDDSASTSQASTVVCNCNCPACNIYNTCPATGGGMTTVFSQPGELELTRNTLLATLLTLGKEWEIKFQFKPTNYDNSGFTNLIHLTIGGDETVLGDRTPAIFFKPDIGMEVATSIGATPNHYIHNITPPPVGEWSTLTLTQRKSGTSTTFSVTINGVAPFRPVENPTPREFSNVKVFASDNFRPAQPGLMKNLVIKTSL